jgi:hypothetical protein
VKSSTGSVVVVLLLLSSAGFGCRSTYYSAWEKMGWAKRDILVDRVKDGRDEQQKAKEEFKTTLQKFQELTNFQGGDLEAKYKKLNSAYESCKDRADAVSKQIASIDQVANDMFKEWKQELSQYQNAELKRSSEQKLRDTQDRYGQLIGAMRKSEQTMQPVLAAFHDQVLFLKHNLNAAAISSLQTTAAGIEQDVQKLIADMEASINEANAFINQMKT